MVYAGSIAFVALFPDLFLAAFRNVICLKERCDLIGEKNRNIQPHIVRSSETHCITITNGGEKDRWKEETESLKEENDQLKEEEDL